MDDRPDPPLRYDLLAIDAHTQARLGRVTTRHGSFDTPAFMPVGTQGTVKGLLPDHVAATGSQIILGNDPRANRGVGKTACRRGSG